MYHCNAKTERVFFSKSLHPTTLDYMNYVGITEFDWADASLFGWVDETCGRRYGYHSSGHAGDDSDSCFWTRGHDFSDLSEDGSVSYFAIILSIYRFSIEIIAKYERAVGCSQMELTQVVYGPLSTCQFLGMQLLSTHNFPNASYGKAAYIRVYLDNT